MLALLLTILLFILGASLVLFIGKRFFTLALKFDMSKWGWGMIGICVFYACVFVALSGLSAITGLVKPWSQEALVLALGLPFFGLFTIAGAISLPFGMFICGLLYTTLRKAWKKKRLNEKGKPEGI